MSLGPFDFSGGPFLILYGLLFVVTIVAGLVIPRRLRPEGRGTRVTDDEQLAYLAGGRTRFGDAVVARLLATQALVMHGRERFSVNQPDAGKSPAERSVLALYPPIQWATIERALKPQAGTIVDKLVRNGLFASNAELANLRFWATLPYLILFTFGAVKWVIGNLRDRPVGILSALLVVTLVFALIRYLTVDRRTRGGIHALQDARLQAQRLSAAPTAPEMGLAVALFGTAVLVGSGFDDFHKLRNTSSSDGGGGDGGSDGGGCGGGCGGCS